MKKAIGFKYDMCVKCRLSVFGIYRNSERKLLCDRCMDGSNYDALTLDDINKLKEVHGVECVHCLDRQDDPEKYADYEYCPECGAPWWENMLNNEEEYNDVLTCHNR